LNRRLGPIFSLDILGKRKIFSPCQQSNPFMVESNRNVLATMFVMITGTLTTT